MRTKHVTYEPVPTLRYLKGLAVYGPSATLFTLGRDSTVQQFDLNSPPTLVANVQHAADLLPPSPPDSTEEHQKRNTLASIGSSVHSTQDPVPGSSRDSLLLSSLNQQLPALIVIQRPRPQAPSLWQLRIQTHIRHASLSWFRKRRNSLLHYLRTMKSSYLYIKPQLSI